MCAFSYKHLRLVRIVLFVNFNIDLFLKQIGVNENECIIYLMEFWGFPVEYCLKLPPFTDYILHSIQFIKTFYCIHFVSDCGIKRGSCRFYTLQVVSIQKLLPRLTIQETSSSARIQSFSRKSHFIILIN